MEARINGCGDRRCWHIHVVVLRYEGNSEAQGGVFGMSGRLSRCTAHTGVGVNAVWNNTTEKVEGMTKQEVVIIHNPFQVF